MSTCNRLDLQTLGSQPMIMPNNLPDHCFELHRQLIFSGTPTSKLRGRNPRVNTRAREDLTVSYG